VEGRRASSGPRRGRHRRPCLARRACGARSFRL